MNTPAPQQDLDAARLLLSRLGVDPADLITTAAGHADSAPDQRALPTIRDWIPVVTGLVSPSTARSYGSYWNAARWRGVAAGQPPGITAVVLEVGCDPPRLLLRAPRGNALVVVVAAHRAILARDAAEITQATVSGAVSRGCL